MFALLKRPIAVTSLPISAWTKTSKPSIYLARYCSFSHSPTQYDTFFRNTSQRWIFNEEKQLKERYVKFNPLELQRAASQAIGQNLPNINKIAEGGFNKVFLLNDTDNGREVIARIPTPIAGPPHYTTASEVATMNFLRTVLSLPVPKVLAYAASSDNPVGAEYIIMEKVEGESLASRWLSLTTKEVAGLMTQIAEMEQKIFSFRFPGYGSIYHGRDLGDECQIPLQLEDFCIGPVADRMSWHGERQQMKIDRGPCKCFIEYIQRVELTCVISGLSSEDCLTSAARREMTCLRHAKPQPRQTFLLPTEHSVNPDEHMSLLERFLQLAPFLVPKDSSFSAPVLRHPDLTLNNILLAPGTTNIVSIIDWQDAIVFPSFLKAGYPAFCEHDSSKTQSLQIPKLPENFTSMSPEEQIQSKTKWRLDEANPFYTAATGIYNEAHMKNLKMPHLAMRQYLFRETGYPWDADIINLRMALVGITSPNVWDSISPLPCPVSFSDTERETTARESEGWKESEALLKTIRDNIGIDLEGGTTPENFEWASLRNMEFRLEMQRQCEEHERELCWQNWPFKDDGDCSLPPVNV